MKLRSLIEQELDYPIKKKVGFARSGELNTDFGRNISDFYKFYRNPNLDDKPEGLFTDMSMAVYEKFPETGEQLATINDLAMEFYENIGDPKAKDLPGNYDVKSDETVAEYLFSKINLINVTSKDILSQIEENGDFKALDLQRIEEALGEMNEKLQGPAPQTNIDPVGFKINEMKKAQLRKIIRESIKGLMNEQSTGCDSTMQWVPWDPNSTKNLNWWNSMMKGKIDNKINTSNYWANNGACWFLQKRIDHHSQFLGRTDPIWHNQLLCKIESLSSGGYLANEYGC